MNNIWKYVLAGCLLAIGGMFVGELAGEIFTGMEWSNAFILGFCMYLCVIVVTCTGIIINKIDSAPKPTQEDADETDKQ